MALQDVFLSPLGLLGLLALVPVILLYLVQPDPRRMELPTLRLLVDDRGEDRSHPLLERLKRSLLLLVQLSVLVGLVLAIAGPYVSVSESRTVEETVLVVDGSASMATQTGDGTRFQNAVAAARDSTTGTNSIVFVGGRSRIPLRSGGAAEVDAALSGLSVTDAPGDLAGGISQAAAIAGEDARIVVVSDFAGDTAWASAVRSARARGLRVELRQFGGGGEGNVGIVDRSFSGGNVTLSVKNFGDSPVTRTVSLGERRRALELGPDDVARVTFAVPAGGGRVTLSPADSFPTDDVAYVAAPSDPTVDVLVLTNDRNRHLLTALSVMDAVRPTVAEPPTTVSDDYDVILYSDTDPDRLLRGSVEAGRDLVERGGGVGILAQPELPDTYGDLLLLSPIEADSNPSIGDVTADELTRGIDFPPPGEYHRGELRAGTALVRATDGTPILATESRGPGRVLYYGYVAESDSFRLNYQYPVFWKRAVYYLAGREPLPSLNRETGSRLQLPNETAIGTPDGTVTARTLVLDRAGVYTVGNRRVGVSLYDERESDVTAEPLEDRVEETGVPAREEASRVPRPLTWLVALVALSFAVGEVAYLRRRGDL